MKTLKFLLKKAILSADIHRAGISCKELICSFVVALVSGTQNV